MAYITIPVPPAARISSLPLFSPLQRTFVTKNVVSSGFSGSEIVISSEVVKQSSLSTNT